MTDSEVARRAGLAQTRFASYVSDKHEPDLATLMRICAVLGVSSSEVLEAASGPTDGLDAIRARISTAMLGLDQKSLHALALVADGLLSRSSRALRPRKAPLPKE